MNILYTIDNNFVPQLSAAMCSVCENNKNVEDIHFYLFSMNISKENKKKLTDFIESYKRKLDIIEIPDLKTYFTKDFDTNGWTNVVLARLLLDKLLPNDIDRVLYLDADSVVLGDLSDFYNLDLKGKVLAMAIEPTVNKERKNKLGLKKYYYHNSGVLLIDLKKWRTKNIGNKVIDFFIKNKRVIFAPDQDALNGELKDNIYSLPPKYNYFNIYNQYNYRFFVKLLKPLDYISKDVYDDSVKNPLIIHYLGEERPWRKGNRHKYKKQYIKYLNLTPYSNQGYENGWTLYFICWNIFNFVMKPFPSLRYKIMDYLIPKVIAKRRAKLKK